MWIICEDVIINAAKGPFMKRAAGDKEKGSRKKVLLLTAGPLRPDPHSSSGLMAIELFLIFFYL